MTKDQFEETLLNLRDPSPFTPRAFHNKQGDSVEFLFSDEDFVAERIDSLVTVYYGQHSGELVGCVIKGCTTRLQDFLKENPGLLIEVSDGGISLAHFFAAKQYKSGDKVHQIAYKKLREQAERYHDMAVLELCEV